MKKLFIILTLITAGANATPSDPYTLDSFGDCVSDATTKAEVEQCYDDFKIDSEEMDLESWKGGAYDN